MSDAAVRQPVGIFYTWWRGDDLPPLPPRSNLVIEQADDVRRLPDDILPYLDRDEAPILTLQRHKLYLARVGGDFVGFGWAATTGASIGELGVEMRLPPGNRYLWGFVTLPAWRGQGIYPRLIQAMLCREADAERFWIGHDYDNKPSARGILKAGFVPIGEVIQSADGGLRYVPSGPPERSHAGAALLGMTPAAR